MHRLPNEAMQMTAISRHEWQWWAVCAAGLFFGVPRASLAQTGTVSGTVVTQGSQRPLAGVEIGVAGGSRQGTVTDGSGRFKLGDLPGT